MWFFFFTSLCIQKYVERVAKTWAVEKERGKGRLRSKNMIRNHMPGDQRTVVGAHRKRATGRRGHHRGRRSQLYFMPRVGCGGRLRPRTAGPLVVPPLEQDVAASVRAQPVYLTMVVVVLSLRRRSSGGGGRPVAGPRRWRIRGEGAGLVSWWGGIGRSWRGSRQ